MEQFTKHKEGQLDDQDKVVTHRYPVVSHCPEIAGRRQNDQSSILRRRDYWRPVSA